MNKKFDRWTLTALGLLILIIGWYNIFSGFAGVILAEDFDFFIEVEDFILVEQTITAESIIFQNAVRMVLGFFLVFFGNFFLLSGAMLDKKFCHPCVGDIKEKLK